MSRRAACSSGSRAGPRARTLRGNADSEPRATSSHYALFFLTHIPPFCHRVRWRTPTVL